jgi:hypothetical protein
MAEISRRAQSLAELAGEVLAIGVGLWLWFGLGWDEFGPTLVLIGAIGFVVTSVRTWKMLRRPADEATTGGEPSPIDPVT